MDMVIHAFTEKKYILIVEDEPLIADLIELTLRPLEMTCIKAESAEQAQQYLKEHVYNLILVDWMLPGKQGIQFLKEIQTFPQFKYLPKIMITAKGDTASIVQALEFGADDYLVKPFNPEILLARSKNLLRRAEGNIEKNESQIVSHFGLVIDFSKVEVKLNSEIVHLTPSEFKLLGYLLKSRGKVLSRSQLIDLIQGQDVTVTGRTIDTHVFALRKKLGSWSDHIETIRAVGYRIHFNL